MPATSSPTPFAPSPPARREKIAVRLSAAELQWLDARAADHDLSRSDLIRAVFSGRIDLPGSPTPSGPSTDMEV